MSSERERRDSGSFRREDLADEYGGPDRRHPSREIVLTSPAERHVWPSWLKAIAGTLIVLSAALLGSVVTHEREAQSQNDRIEDLNTRLATDEDRLKSGFVTQQEFTQFSARVLESLQRIESEQMRTREELEKRH